MQENFKMIKEKGMVFTSGVMEGNLKDGGMRTNNMV